MSEGETPHLADMTPEQLERAYVDVALNHIARMKESGSQDLEVTKKLAEFNARSIFLTSRGRISDRLKKLVEEIVT